VTASKAQTAKLVDGCKYEARVVVAHLFSYWRWLKRAEISFVVYH
jgi:hypothetical protein